MKNILSYFFETRCSRVTAICYKHYQPMRRGKTFRGLRTVLEICVSERVAPRISTMFTMQNYTAVLLETG